MPEFRDKSEYAGDYNPEDCEDGNLNTLMYSTSISPEIPNIRDYVENIYKKLNNRTHIRIYPIESNLTSVKIIPRLWEEGILKVYYSHTERFYTDRRRHDFGT